MPSVLWHCWLGGRKGTQPVKTEWWGAGMVICLEWVADLHMSQLMPLPLTVSCFSKIQIGLTFLVPAYPGSLGKRAVKWVCVCNITNELRMSSQSITTDDNWLKPVIFTTTSTLILVTCLCCMANVSDATMTRNEKMKNTKLTFPQHNYGRKQAI